MLGNDRLEKMLENAGATPKQVETVMEDYSAACARIDAATPMVDVTVGKMVVTEDKIKLDVTCPNTDANYSMLRRITGAARLVRIQTDFITVGEGKKKAGGEGQPELPTNKEPEVPTEAPPVEPKVEAYTGPICSKRRALLPEAKGTVAVRYNGPELTLDTTSGVFVFADNNEFAVQKLTSKTFEVLQCDKDDNNPDSPPRTVRIPKERRESFTAIPDPSLATYQDPTAEEPEPPEPETKPIDKKPSQKAKIDLIYNIGQAKIDLPEGTFMPFTKFRVVEMNADGQIVIREIPDVSTGEPITQGDGVPFPMSTELFDELFANND